MAKNVKFYKGIYVFDMGRVITKPANLQQMYRDSNAKCTFEEFNGLFYHSEESYKSYEGKIGDDEFFEFMRIKSGSDKSAQELKQLYYDCKGGIYEDTVKLIKKLKDEGNKVYLLSNLRPVDYEYLSANMKLSMFDMMFLSCGLNMSKPSKEIFEHVINVLGTNDFTFVDDSENNIKAAREAGISNPVQSTGENINGNITKILRL